MAMIFLPQFIPEPYACALIYWLGGGFEVLTVPIKQNHRIFSAWPWKFNHSPYFFKLADGSFSNMLQKQDWAVWEMHVV